MLEEINKFLKSHGWSTEDDNLFKKTIEVEQAQVFIINGQQVNQKSETKEVTIKYNGEGNMWNAGEEKIPLCGFNFNNSADIWVDGIEDFKFWYQNYFREQ